MQGVGGTVDPANEKNLGEGREREREVVSCTVVFFSRAFFSHAAGWRVLWEVGRGGGQLWWAWVLGAGYIIMGPAIYVHRVSTHLGAGKTCS